MAFTYDRAILFSIPASSIHPRRGDGRGGSVIESQRFILGEDVERFGELALLRDIPCRWPARPDRRAGTGAVGARYRPGDEVLTVLTRFSPLPARFCRSRKAVFRGRRTKLLIWT